MEGQDELLNDHYSERMDPIIKCYEVANKKGYKVFAIQNGGMCLASYDAEFRYNNFGPSDQCQDGLGGSCVNDVYAIGEFRGNLFSKIQLKTYRVIQKNGHFVSYDPNFKPRFMKFGT